MLKVPQTPGDVFDRITILLLKVANSDRRVEALEELVKLSGAVAKQVEDDEWVAANPAINELLDVNEELWDLEEEIRAAEDEDKVEMIKQIHEKNRQRHEIKNVINEHLDSDVFEVKDYSVEDEEDSVPSYTPPAYSAPGFGV